MTNWHPDISIAYRNTLIVSDALTAAGWQVYRLRATDVRHDPLAALTTIAAWVQAGVREEPS